MADPNRPRTLADIIIQLIQTQQDEQVNADTVAYDTQTMSEPVYCDAGFSFLNQPALNLILPPFYWGPVTGGHQGGFWNLFTYS